MPKTQSAPCARRPLLAVMAALAASVMLSACSPSYQYRAIPVQPLESYPGQATTEGAHVGAMALYDSRQLSQLFGFDLKKAGVIPVQVKIRNTGNSDITVRSGSTMTDEHGQTWEVLPSSAVFQRIDDYTSGSLSMEEGAKRTLMWGLAGAVVGAAVGVAGGTDVGTAVGKGAAVGAGAGAASAMVGLGKKDTSEDVERDFSERSLESRIIEPGQEVTGYLYFPSESALPKNLRLNLSQGGYRQALDLAL